MRHGGLRLLALVPPARAAAVRSVHSASLGQVGVSLRPAACRAVAGARAAAKVRMAMPASGRVDLRSDTVTQPTEAMRRAMAEAEVGDDVFGDDPTVRLLEAEVASLFAKDEAVFVPTGTMANLIAVMAHTWERGSEYIVGDRAHIFLYEQGGAAQLGGAHPRTVANHDDGTVPLEAVRRAIRTDDQHYPITRLLCLEQTHNMCGGAVLPTSHVDEVGDLARDHGVPLHVDGARIWHAAASMAEAPARCAQAADSVAVCLSKGLGAPAGSLVVGSSKFVGRARRLRKVLGGGMRQTGVLAAAGLHALRHHLPRIADDHVTAAALATGLAQCPGIAVDTSRVQTNLLFFDVLPGASLSAAALVEACAAKGVDFLEIGNGRCRMVTHLHVSLEDVDYTLDTVATVMDEARL